MAPAAYLQRYHGPVTEASAPAQMVSSVREAVQSVSASASLHKAAENRPKLQPTWHSQRHHSIDKERKPLSLPTLPPSPTCLSSFMSHSRAYGKSFVHMIKNFLLVVFCVTAIYAPTPRRHSIKVGLVVLITTQI